MTTLTRDIRFSVRQLLKTPTFSLTALLVLALGIGANTVVFSLINILLFQPIPGDERPGQVVGIYVHTSSKPGSYRSFSYLEYEEVRNQSELFSNVMAHRLFRTTFADGQTARRARGAMATGNYFATLGVSLAAGRSFSRDEERPGSQAAVMVLGYGAWQRLGGQASVLGRTIIVNGHPFSVVGIAPEGFAGTTAVMGPDFWVPIGAAGLVAVQAWGGNGTPASAGSARTLMVVGRLKPHVTVKSADVALRTISTRLQLARALDGTAPTLVAAPRNRLSQGDSPSSSDNDELVLPLSALLGAALMILAIAGLNVANMQLARGTSRRKEIATRLALGAGRRRIVGQLLTECALLAVIAGAVGLAASVWTMKGVAASLARIVEDSVVVASVPDWRVFVASLVYCTVAAIAAGLGPAWRLSGLDLLPEMKNQGSAVAARGHRYGGPRHLLVGSQIALSLALLAAAGLFVRGAMIADEADPGYRFANQWLVRIDATPAGDDPFSRQEALGRLVAGLRSTPGIDSVAATTQVAFGRQNLTRRVRRPDASSPGGAAAAGSRASQAFDIGTSYFQTLQLPLLRGRDFTEAEVLGTTASKVVIIDEPLAAALFPGQDPLGRIVDVETLRSEPRTEAREVVGVAPGVRHQVTDRGPVPHVYLPLGSQDRAVINLHVRAAADAGGAQDRVRRVLNDAARIAGTRLATLDVQTLAEARDAGPANWVIRMAGRTFGAFGLIALFMATIGLYGVKAYLVGRRTREIGIRQAVGATAGDIIRMVMSEGAVLLAGSVAVGVLLAVGLGKAVQGLLVGVEAFDLLVLLTATGTLAIAVLAACYVPARRATLVSPVAALRAE